MEVYGSCNAPRAVLYSGIIYCLRCLVGSDIPLNQGCLAPIKFTHPPALGRDEVQSGVIGEWCWSRGRS